LGASQASRAKVTRSNRVGCARNAPAEGAGIVARAKSLLCSDSAARETKGPAVRGYSRTLDLHAKAILSMRKSQNQTDKFLHAAYCYCSIQRASRMGRKVIPKRPSAKRRTKPRRLIRKKRPQKLSEASQREAKSGLRRPPAQPNSERIISTLPVLSFERLRGIWKNCLVKMASKEDGHWRNSAIQVLSAIEMEWDRRSRVARPDEFFAWPST
jgi:hypothetical protein